MIQVVGVIGYQNSGKTTLIRTLARELVSRGHEVAVVKHLSHPLDLPGKDTATLGEVVGRVGFISPQSSGVFWNQALSLENLLPYLEADVVLVEGFKHERTLLGARPKHPTSLDPRRIAYDAFKQRALARHRNSLRGFNDAGLYRLLDDRLDENRLRDLLRRLKRPDHPKLVRLIAEDLSHRHSRG